MRKFDKQPACAQSFKGVEPMTRQSERYLTDIERIRNQGYVPPDPSQLTFADVSADFDYQEAAGVIASLKESFMQLPSRVRDGFDNDPSRLLEFVRDPQNHEQAIELGILPRPVKVDNPDVPKPPVESASGDTPEKPALPPSEPKGSD